MLLLRGHDAHDRHASLGLYTAFDPRLFERTHNPTKFSPPLPSQQSLDSSAAGPAVLPLLLLLLLTVDQCRHLLRRLDLQVVKGACVVYRMGFNIRCFGVDGGTYRSSAVHVDQSETHDWSCLPLKRDVPMASTAMVKPWARTRARIIFWDRCFWCFGGKSARHCRLGSNK